MRYDAGQFDIAVVGAGHAGVEAAPSGVVWSARPLGSSTPASTSLEPPRSKISY